MSGTGTQPLAARTIAVPETREMELFAAMLERRGATVVRCPMVAIHDAADPAPVLAWCRAFSAGGCDDLILLTGEGLKRLLKAIERHDPALQASFLAALARVRKITRGPKPARALRELGLRPDLAASVPTTGGVIESLRGLDLHGRRIGVQLYGSDPNEPLMQFLRDAGAQALPVAPYRYAEASETTAVRQLLARMQAGEIDAIAFTSSAQVERLYAVAPAEEVSKALSGVLVAAVGPVVGATLARHGIVPRVSPTDSFFLKPLTSELENALG